MCCCKIALASDTIQQSLVAVPGLVWGSVGRQPATLENIGYCARDLASSANAQLVRGAGTGRSFMGDELFDVLYDVPWALAIIVIPAGSPAWLEEKGLGGRWAGVGGSRGPDNSRKHSA